MLNEKMGSNKTNAFESHSEVSEEICQFLEKNCEIVKYLIKNLILVTKYTDSTIIERQDLPMFSDPSDVDNEEENQTQLENDIKCYSTKLKNNILDLQQVFPQDDVLKQNNEFYSSSESEDLNKFSNMDARADMLNNISNFSNEICELLVNLIKLYKADRDVKAAKIIRKKLSKIYKSLKLLPYRINPDKNMTSSTSRSKLVYLNAEHNLSLHLSYLIRKVSRVIKTYKKNFNMDAVKIVQNKHPRSEILKNSINLERGNILSPNVNKDTSQERHSFHEHENNLLKNNGYLNLSERIRLQESVLRNAEDLNETETPTKNFESRGEVKENSYNPMDLVEVQMDKRSSSQEFCNTGNEEQDLSVSPRKRKKKIRNTVKEEDPNDSFYTENYLNVEIDEHTINFRIGDEVLSNVSFKSEKDNSIASDSPKKQRNNLEAIIAEEICNNTKTEKETSPKKKRKRSNEPVDDKENYSNNEIKNEITETTAEICTNKCTKEISNNCIPIDNIHYQSYCEVHAELIKSKKDKKKLKKRMREKQASVLEEVASIYPKNTPHIDLTDEYIGESDSKARKKMKKNMNESYREINEKHSDFYVNSENLDIKKKNKKSKNCDKDVILISDDVSSEKSDCKNKNTRKRKSSKLMDDASMIKDKKINRRDKSAEIHKLEVENGDMVKQSKKKKKYKYNNQSSEDDVHIVYESIDLSQTSKEKYKKSDIILNQDTSTDFTNTNKKHSKKSKRERTKNKPVIINNCVEQVDLTANNDPNSDEVAQIVHKKSSKNNNQHQKAKLCNDNVIVKDSDRIKKKPKLNGTLLNEDESIFIEDDDKKEAQIKNNSFKAEQNENTCLDATDLQKDTSRLLQMYLKRLEEQNVENENAKTKMNNSIKTENLQEDDSFDEETNTEFTVTAGDFKMAYDIITDKKLTDNDKYLHLLDIYESAKDKQIVSSDIVQKLSNLDIRIDWNIPPVHEVDTPLSASAKLDNDQKKKLLELGAKFNVAFTDKDDNIIKENWKSFCKRYNIIDDPKLFSSVKINGKIVMPIETRKKFLQYLARGLQDRYLLSICRRFNVLYKPYKSGRFTPEEDLLILEHMKLFETNFKKFALLAPVLNRDRVAIEHRYLILKDKEEEKQTEKGWDLEAMTEMLKIIMEALDLTNVEDLRTEKLPNSIFHDVATKMNRTAKAVYQCWYKKLYVRLFSEERLYNDEIKIKLINTLYELRVQHQTRINWNAVISEFPKGITKEFLAAQLAILKTTCQMQRGKISQLSDCIKYLHTYFVPHLINKGDMKVTPRLRFKNGILEEYE